MTSPIKAALAAAAERRSQEQQDHDRRQRMEDAESAAAEQARNAFLHHCRIAEPADYADWLAGYLTAGGEISHPYDYRFDSMQHIDGSPARASWYVLTSRPEGVPALYGAKAIHVIVPAGAGLTPDRIRGSIGHNSFYFTDGWTAYGRVGWVPLYTDVAELLARR